MSQVRIVFLKLLKVVVGQIFCVQNTVVCPEWRLAFELKKEGDIVHIIRTDPRFPQPFPVATWERHDFSKDKLRIFNPGGYDSGNLPVDSLFPKTSGCFSSYS